MDKMLYTAMNSARQASQAQTAISHNLSNVNTTGFKSHLNTFTSWHVSGPGYNTRVMNQQEADNIDLTEGPLSTTDRELDVAVNGDGFIVVLNKEGAEAYTKAGDFRLDSTGQLTTGAGFAVLGNGGPITIPPAEKLDIGIDGSISIVPVGQSAESLVLVDRIKLVNPNLQNLHKDADGLLQLIDGSVAPVAAEVKLENGVLERSNVNAVGQMIQLITNARQFEASINLMKEAKTLDEASASLLRNS